MNLLFIEKSNINYSVNRYTGLSTLLRVEDFNYNEFLKVSNRINYTLPNQHVLVQLLLKLGIDPQWSFDYLVNYIKLKSDSVASLLKMTCIYNRGTGTTNVLYYNSYYEHLILINQDDNYYREYETKELETFCPIIPLYSTQLKHSFNNVATNEYINNVGEYNGFALIGVDIVLLAISYWRYLKDLNKNNINTAIAPHNFLCKFPLVNARILANQLSTINILFTHLVNEEPIKNLVKHDLTKYITKEDNGVLTDYTTWIYNQLINKRPYNLPFLLANIPLLFPNLTNNLNYVISDYENNNNINWLWQLPAIKLYCLKLLFLNKTKTKDIDSNSEIVAWSRNYENYTYKRVNDLQFKKHYKDLCLLLIKLNELNMAL